MKFLNLSILPIRNPDGTLGSTYIITPTLYLGYGPFVTEKCPAYKYTYKFNEKRGRVTSTRVKFGWPSRRNDPLV